MRIRFKISHFLIAVFALLQLASVKVEAQQYFQYSQYMFNRLVFNPAVTGTKDAMVATMQLRKQWNDIPGSPLNQLIQFHTPLKKRKIGLGIEAMSNSVGPKKDAGLALYYSYKLPLFNGNLSFGLKYGIRNYTFNWKEVDFYQTGDSYQSNGSTVFTTHQTATGVYWYSTKSYLGFSAIQLIPFGITKTQTGQNLSETKMHYFATACKSFALNEKIVFSPTLLLKMVSHAPVSADINFNVLFREKLWLGIGYRSAYGTNVMICYKAGKKMRIGYSYDMGANKIGQVGGITHELLLEFNFNIFDSKVVSPRYL